MSNRTDALAKEVHGTNPQRIVEKILRLKIYSSQYWKESCFGLTAETLVDRAIELKHLGGTYGGIRKPTKFMCLLLKMLQIQPEMEIIAEFIKNEEYKYVRCLGMLYLRCVGRAVDVYKYLEPRYADYSKIRVRAYDGWKVSHVDEFVDELLTSDYTCDIALPFLPKRHQLESQGLLGPRVNHAQGLGDDLDETKGTDGGLGPLRHSSSRGSSPSSESSSGLSATQQRKRHKSELPAPSVGRLVLKSRSAPSFDERQSNSRRDDSSKPGDAESLNIEATNELRRKLGLKPLRV